MFCILMSIGGLGCINDKHASLAIGILLIISTLCNRITIGPITYAIVSETPSGRLRYKTVVIGRAVYNLTAIFHNSVTPRMISPLGKSIHFVIVPSTDRQVGIGVRRLPSSMAEPISFAASGVGSDCPRLKAVPSARSICCLKTKFRLGLSNILVQLVSSASP